MSGTIPVTAREVLEAANPAHAFCTAVEQIPAALAVAIRCSCGETVLATSATAEKLKITFMELKRVLAERVPNTSGGIAPAAKRKA